MDGARAIIVVQDAVLASSLEFALLAAGMAPMLCDWAEPSEGLPLAGAAILILGPCAPPHDLAAFVMAVRVAGWQGLIILITGDCRQLRAVFKGVPRIVILEMPFVAADLIAAIRAEWPPTDGLSP